MNQNKITMERYSDDELVDKEFDSIEHHYGAYLVHYTDGSDDLYQTDWDYPSLAVELGWNKPVRPLRRPDGRFAGVCRHESTDGTVTCLECGMTASEFIGAAMDFLDSLC